MPDQFNLKSCADCRWFEPLNKSHLCEQGTCYLNEKPKLTERYDYCENFTAINGEFDE